MPTVLITIPAPGFQRAPHAFHPHEWPEYYAEHLNGLLDAVGHSDVSSVRGPSTGPFPRIGGWATFELDVADLAAAEAARDAYWSEHFAVQTPEAAVETADKVTDAIEQALRVLASLFGAKVQGLDVAAEVAGLVNDGVDSIIAGETPDVREAIALIVEAVDADVGKAESAGDVREDVDPPVGFAHRPAALSYRLRALSAG